MRKTNTQLMLAIGAVLLGGGLQIASANALQDKAGDTSKFEEEAGDADDVKATNSIIGVADNGKGTVTYNGKKVWKGKIKSNRLRVAARSSTDEDAKYATGSELAAAWDGDKLIWENVKGAGQALEPELRRMLKKLKGFDKIEKLLE